MFFQDKYDLFIFQVREIVIESFNILLNKWLSMNLNLDMEKNYLNFEDEVKSM